MEVSDAAAGVMALHQSGRNPNPWQVTYSWGAVDILVREIERLRAELAHRE